MRKEALPDPARFRTEEKLKEEARRRREEQARADAMKPPPSPKKRKLDNFWYHYKWHTIASVTLVCLVIFFLRDTVFSTKPDANLIMVTGEPVGIEALSALEVSLNNVVGDDNGDGKRIMLINYVHYPLDGQAGPETETPTASDDYAAVMKLTTLLSANVDPLYLIDDTIYEHLSLMGSEDGEPQSIFQPLDAIGAADGDRLSLSRTVIADTPGCESLGGLTFCLRAPSSEKKKAAEYYQACLEFLQGIVRTP